MLAYTFRNIESKDNLRKYLHTPTNNSRLLMLVIINDKCHFNNHSLTRAFLVQGSTFDVFISVCMLTAHVGSTCG